MKYKIIILILFLSSFVYAGSLNLTLDETTLGTQNPITGSLKLNIHDIPSVGELIFDIAGSEKNFNLTEVCSLSHSSCSLSSEKYEILEKEIQDPTITFSGANTNSDYAISLYLAQPLSLDISDATLSLSGQIHENSYPNKVKLDIGSDGFDWNYIGDYIRSNNQIVTHLIPTDYLFDKIPDSNLKGVLYGGGRYELCEKVKIPLTKRVIIKTYVQIQLRNTGEFPGEGYLSGRIRDQTGNVLLNDLGLRANCSMQSPPINADWVWRECAIENLTINEDQDYYLCVYSNPDSSSPPLTTLPYYNIALERPTSINAGYDCSGALCSNQCCYSGGYDYFIEGYWSENNLNFSITKEINKTRILLPALRNNIISGNCKYKTSYNGEEYCLIPLIVSSNSKGKVKFSNLLVTYNHPVQGTSFAKISFIPKRINYINNITLDLEDLNLVTPSSTGDHEIDVSIKYGGRTYDSTSEDIKILDSPRINFNVPLYGYVGGSISFSANATRGKSPYNYSWDFGDGTFSSIQNPTHSYNIEGVYNVTVEVMDLNGIISTISQEIEILNLEEILEPLLNDTYTMITNLSSSFNSATGDTKEVIEILGLTEKVNAAKTNISGYILSYRSAINDEYNKNQKLAKIYDSLTSLKKEIPYTFKINSINYNPKLLSSDGSYPDYDADLQNSFNVISKAYTVTIKYVSNEEESLRLIKKEVSLSGNFDKAYIYEYIPKEVSPSISDEDILSQGFEILEEDPLIRFPISQSKEIIYKLPEGNLDSLVGVKTYLVLEDYSGGFEGEPECGDGICSPLETGYCDKDCKRKTPWGWFIFLFLVLVGGIYYINFYKGKWNFQELVKFITLKLKPEKLFNTEKDKISLETYIKKNLKFGMTEQQLRLLLAKRKWNKKQLDFIFNKLKKEKFK